MANSIDRQMIETGERHVATERQITWDFLYPRVWKLMLLAALPLLMAVEPAFERLEHADSLGSHLAYPLFSALLVGYGILLCVLKKKNL